MEPAEKERIREWLREHPREKGRLARIYRRHGADAARGLLGRMVNSELHDLKRRELRELLGVEPDYEGYRQAVEAHRTAWAEVGWRKSRLTDPQKRLSGSFESSFK
ncbi:MAG: hypothetical protein ACPLSY_03640 [Moorellaceae bacterium]